MKDVLPQLALSNVTAGYNGKAALTGVALEVMEGEVVALIGANGAGKSTLLKAIVGIVPISEGDIRFRGHSIGNRPPHANVRVGIGYLPQGAPAFVELTVAQNLAIAGLYLEKSKRAEQIGEMLELFPALRNRLDRKAGVLSGGERQMLGLARSFVGNPTLLLLDEPSSGLHPELTAALFEKLRQINSRYKIALLIVEQNISKALEISNRVYGLRRGEIIEQGPPDAFHRKESLISLFSS
jgi:branched-chain amino acid transport system ATP-binding protein